MIDRDDPELNTLHPELEAIFKQIGGVPRLPTPSRSTIPKLRQNFKRLVSRYNTSPFVQSSLPKEQTWVEFDRDVPVRDGSTVEIRVYVPNDADGPLALGMMLHAGGWFMGDLENEKFMCKFLCSRLNIAMVNVNFRLYPDVDFPVPVTDCYDVIKWLSAHATELDERIDLTEGFVVGGSSGGGTYAGIACHLARNDNLKPGLTGCYLAGPIFGDRMLKEGDVPDDSRSIFGEDRNKSHFQHADAPITDRKTAVAIRDFANFVYDSPLLSPFLFESHDDLPRTYSQVCGIDPWRDTGIIYHEELEKAGQEVKIDVYKGLLHCWWTSFPSLSPTKLWLEDTLKGWQWLLRRDTKEQVVRSAAKI